jgi:hypothetical protein
MLTSSPCSPEAHSQEAERELSQQSLEKIHHDPRMLCLLLTCFNVVRLPMVGELVYVFLDMCFSGRDVAQDLYWCILF